MTCHWKYFAGMVEHRRPSGAPSPALAYGSGWHHIMQWNYTAGEMSKDQLIDGGLDYALARWQQPSNTDDYRTFNRLMVEYEKYLNTYGLPWEEEGKTLGWPDRPMVELAIEMPIEGARHPYVGKLDRVFKVSGQNLIEDHKTASMFRTDYFRQWELDNQMMGYAMLGSIVTGEPIAGVRINLHVIRKSDSVFERRTILFSKPRLDDWAKNYDVWLARIEADMVRHKIGDPTAFPRNYSACSTKYGMCGYAEICSLAPHLRQAALEQDYQQSPWSPLDAGDEVTDA